MPHGAGLRRADGPRRGHRSRAGRSHPVHPGPGGMGDGMTSLVKDLLARVGTAEAALAEERKGRALLARATDRINELEAEIAQVRRAMGRIVKCSGQSTAGEKGKL